MELVILVTFVAIFTTFLFSSFKVGGSYAQFFFIFAASVFLFFVSFYMLTEGVDITFCGNVCNVTNYNDNGIMLIGITTGILAAATAIFGFLNGFSNVKMTTRM